MRVPSWILLFSSPFVSVALGVDGAWSNPGGGSWTVSGNWVGNSTAGGVSAVSDFAAIDLSSQTTVNLNGARTTGTMRFGDLTPSHDWFLRRGSSNSTLTLDVTSGSPIIEVINRTATLGIDLLGNKGFTKTGAGTLVLSGSNSYSGATVVSNGILRLAPPPSFPQGMQVMPMGDSITYGYNGNNAGYRGPLYGMLLPLAATFQFTGVSTERPGFLPPNQQHHEGRSSYAVQDLCNNLDGLDTTIYQLYGGTDRNPNGGYWITGGGGTGRGPNIPHVVTLMAGTNDLDKLTGFHDRLAAFVDKFTTLCPNARILVARITPVVPVGGNPPADVALCNSIIDQVVAESRAAGKRVHPVDLNTTFPVSTGLIADGVHPNDTGFTWMAMQWYEGIIQACTPEAGTSGGLSASSAVTVANGATLDLAGNKATVASLSVTGTFALGSGGELASGGSVIKSTARITGDGTLKGAVILNGSGFAYPGQKLVFTDTVTLNGVLTPSAGTQIQFLGNFVNNGVINIPPGSSIFFGGNVTNNGVMRYTDGATIQVTGSFENNGTLDLLTGSQDLPTGFVDNGWILTSDALTIPSIAAEGDSIRVSIDSYSGHLYQLQRRTSLKTDSWTDTGAPLSGTTGTRLEFIRPRGSPTGCEFYRIRISP